MCGCGNIYELYGTSVSGKRSSKKYLSRIYCRRRSHGPVQRKRKKSQSHINSIIDMQQLKMFQTIQSNDLHDIKC